MKEPVMHRLRRWVSERFLFFHEPYNYDFDLYLSGMIDIGAVRVDNPEWGIMVWQRKKEHFVRLYVVEVGQVLVWVGNWPYRYGCIYGRSGLPINARCSYKTAKRLRARVEEITAKWLADHPNEKE